jgi:hypothetical protein
MIIRLFLSFSILILTPNILNAQQSIAREWNEVLLEAIRGDFARPTIHARNLFHTSAVMYDSWAVHTSNSDTYFLGKELNGFDCQFKDYLSDNPESDMEETMSYAVYRLLSHRFANSPSAITTLSHFDELFNELGYDNSMVSVDYSSGSAAALGNYLGNKMIEYGLQDGSNEENGYSNLFYEPVNMPIAPAISGNPDITNVNRWQPLSLEVYVDQAGNEIPGGTIDFLSPEWGAVLPFAMTQEDNTIYERDGNEYWVYNDPGAPPYMDLDNVDEVSNEYQWNFELVSLWSSHLDHTDGVTTDISPGATGNITSFPQSLAEYHTFYDEVNGGDSGTGHLMNPSTGLAYEQQIVPRGDYTRVLAEFWADGPESETPPGHWFTLLNYVSDHPELVKKFKGEGDLLENLEWDVKSYFVMGGAMHDAAISSWGIKGWYDYIRPVSALRAMADRGQRSDVDLPNYSSSGMRLVDGFIELVATGDPLAGVNGKHIDKIKIRAWKGPDYIEDPAVDVAGVDWILAENWWPYQRPTFVTPPFAGYVSGHSTYSRAAAEVLTLLTGDPFFPGGMGEFFALKDDFLVFEKGPSVDVTLQWATYRDASDQCSLSRIWGGIHPPADDIPGRIIGEKIGVQSFELAEKHFGSLVTGVNNANNSPRSIFKLHQNPVSDQIQISVIKGEDVSNIRIFDMRGELVKNIRYAHNLSIDSAELVDGIYFVTLNIDGVNYSRKILVKH